ncbi:hypothetical protein PHYSODRAFT_257292 [Phytophthora sojae]|uniref:Protein kinase domain-containing protein n=1 Tax=Phytophthora sojae (strain P6497) TaxID=1094619 RepID=G4YFK2_PHYSP|nr:hypothetical protein PHYSODRAFT_257292 [Phytophthora sojae]EGZ26987.1 hypothetical protein PHYSODRAFT_257292 [Phytophthora sojae]|eukprot:XP_009514262.1 hypothetical protein PHYSODRAFT_257292 [Phytophthora sojae]
MALHTSAGATSASSDDVFADLKTLTYPSDAYHMPPVRAVHARIQSDTPILVDGVFVSIFGDGELEEGYLQALDTVNTASVEGALVYVQAEGINVNARTDNERCKRKSGMAVIVFFEILIAQTNETLAQFQDSWGDTPEYGPMIPMDSKRCTPLSGDDGFPAGCLQFNGDDLTSRAPYPKSYWFSFPSTCPLKAWIDKTDECRSGTRKGLCSYGQGLDGVDCTFAYNILGWVTIDDVVGITSIKNAKTGSTYANYTEWCSADSNHIEFAADTSTGEMESGLPFWEDPLSSTANAARAEALVAKYEETLTSGSTQIEDTLIKAFKALPTPDELAVLNPPCYKTVEACGSGNGCKRVGYSQLCAECDADEGCETGGSGFQYPTLEKAFTTLSDSETMGSVGGSSEAATSSSDAARGGQDGLWNDDVITAKRVPRGKVKTHKLLSKGAFGEVYSGVYNDQPVAVKMLLPSTRGNLQHITQFLAEAKMTATMEHPHIVAFIGFMDGGDLRTLLNKNEANKHPVGVDREKASIALHICQALTYLHSLMHPVIHRDLKSRNVILNSAMEAKLTDFGISKERRDQTMTAGVGTSLWMAPEVMLGEKYDVKADIFSFGVVLSELDVHSLPYTRTINTSRSI